MEKHAQVAAIRLYRDDLVDLSDSEIWEQMETYRQYAFDLFVKRVETATYLKDNDTQYQLCIKGLGHLIGFGFICDFRDLNEDIKYTVDFHEKKAFDAFLTKSYETIKADKPTDKAIYYLNEIEYSTKITLQSIAEDDNIPEIIIHKYKRILAFATDSKEYLKTKMQFPELLQIESSTIRAIEQPIVKGGLSLWDLFLDRSKADLIKQKLIASGHLIVGENDKLHFKPTKSNTRYEVESLRQALNFNQLLNTKIELFQPDIVNVFRNTFEGYDCCVKTLNAKGIPSKLHYYMTICKLD